MKMKEKKTTLNGISTKQLYGDSLSLVTHIEAIDLINYFSIFDVPTELESVFQSVHSRINTSRLKENLNSIIEGINNRSLSPSPSLTFAIGGEVDFEVITNNLSKITYSPTNTLIVDGILPLIALMQLLGFSHPFVKKLATKKTIERNSKVRQEVAQLQIQVTLIFNNSTYRNKSHLLELFNQYNQKETRINTPLFNAINRNKEINRYVNNIATNVDLDSYGGMTNLTNRLTKSDAYITTEATMIRLVLGAISGSEAQDKNKTSEFDFNNNPSKKVKINELQLLIIEFLNAWLQGIKSQLSDRDGYHYSPQVWQALGLVIHEIIKTTTDTITIKQAGETLGQLDYSKSAPHWKKCNTMELDISGTYYKNAAGGGRAFRVGLSKYFIDVIHNFKI